MLEFYLIFENYYMITINKLLISVKNDKVFLQTDLEKCFLTNT